jgi:hypothetical protein
MRTQLPETLFRQFKRIAEVIWRGVENMVLPYPWKKLKPGGNFSFPAPIKGRLKVSDPERLKDILRSDQELFL